MCDIPMGYGFVAIWGKNSAEGEYDFPLQLCKDTAKLLFVCHSKGFIASASAHCCLPRGCLSQQTVLPPSVLQVLFSVISEPHPSKRNLTNFFVQKFIVISSNLLNSSHVNNEKDKCHILEIASSDKCISFIRQHLTALQFQWLLEDQSLVNMVLIQSYLTKGGECLFIQVKYQLF